MKLKSVEDLEHFLLEMSSPQTAALMNFSSAFISFVQEYLIEDDHMKIILAGVRILSKPHSMPDSTTFRADHEVCTNGRKD